jgi:hypothetical protein
MSARHSTTCFVMAAPEAAIQSSRVRAPESLFVLLDGRVKPGHDEWGERP